MTWGDEQKSQRSPDPMVIPTEGPMGTGHQLLGRPTLCCAQAAGHGTPSVQRGLAGPTRAPGRPRHSAVHPLA